jgi:hypothetical protein
MRNRSWMTAWTLFAGLGLVTLGTSPAPAVEEDGSPSAIENTVRLEIQISGLGSQGAKISIKPAHPSCQFKTIERTIAKGARGDVVKFEPISVAASTTSADRDCSFEITIAEPGRKPKTFRRGLQLVSPAAGATASVAPKRTLKCYLPATEIAAKDATRPLR